MPACSAQPHQKLNVMADVPFLRRLSLHSHDQRQKAWCSQRASLAARMEQEGSTPGT